MSPAFVVAEYVVSVLICTAVAVYAFSRRRTAGASAFALSAFGQAFWTLGHLFETLSGTLADKVFWDDLQYLGTVAWVVGFGRFADAYVGETTPFRKHFRNACSVFLAGFVALVFTDRFHHLIRPYAVLAQHVPFDELVYPFSRTVLFGGVVLIAMFGVAIGTLLRRFGRAPSFFRMQIGLIVGGELLPLVGVCATMFGFAVAEDRDTTPYTFALGDLLAAWGLFRYGFLDLVPVARDLVVEGMNDSVVVTDSNGRVLDLNPAALAALGKPLAEVIGKRAEEVYREWSDLVARLDSVVDGSADFSAPVNGETHDFDVSITALRDRRAEPVGRVIVARDVSRLKSAERELAARNKELEAAYRELDAFTHSVSHDLRAPLRAIEGFSDILLRTQGGKLDARGEEQLQLIVDGTKRMRQLFEDLLRFSRLGRQPVARRAVDATELVNSVLYDARGVIEERRVQVDVSSLPSCVGDPSLLRQVFLNLIDNALKYSRQKEAPKVEIGAKRDGEATAYFVRDNGVGFDMKNRERLFRVFQRLHDPEAFEGSGVGLAIVASIVQRHGGRVWAESSPGEGATFYFTLSA